MKKKSILLLPFLIFSMALAGCHGTSKKDSGSSSGEKQQGGDGGGGSSTVAVESISLSPTSLTLEVGGSQQLTATIKPTNATDQTITWSTSSSSIATVTNGLVRAVSKGNATITATAGGKNATCNVVVNAPAPTLTGIEAAYSGGAIEVGNQLDTSALSVNKVYSDSTKTPLTSAEFATLHFYADQSCTQEMQTSYIFTDEDIGQHYVYVKFGEYKTSFSITVVAQQPEGVPSYTLRVFTTETNYKMQLNSEETEYSVKVELATDDVFKIKMYDDDDWRGYGNFRSDAKAYVNFTEDEGNIRCLTAGKYVFYVKANKEVDDGKTVWVEEIPDTTGWKAVINKADVAVEVNEEKDGEIMLRGKELHAGDTVIFKDANGSQEHGYDQLKNGQEVFARGLSNEITIPADGTYDFYVELGKAKSIWAKKDGADLPEPVPLTQYVHYGSGENWKDAGLEPFENPNYQEVRITNFALKTNEEFSICMGENDWRNYFDAKAEAAISSGDVVNAEGSYNNFKVANGGLYDIYVKVEKGDNEKTVYIARVGDLAPEKVAVSSVQLNKTELQLYVGFSETLVATVLPENATNKSVHWSGNGEIVSVGSSGQITGLSVGNATVRVSSVDDESKYAECAVTVIEKPVDVVLTGITAEYSGGPIYVGEGLDATYLSLLKVYSDSTTDPFHGDDWKSVHFYRDAEMTDEIEEYETYIFKESDKTVTKIYVKFGEFTASFDVTIEDRPVVINNYILIGESDVKHELVLNNEAVLIDGQTAEYKANGLVISDDDEEIKFYLNGELVTKYGPDGHDVANNTKNNGYGDDVTEKKICIEKAGTVDVYLKTYEDGGTSYWVTGGLELHYYGLVGSFAGGTEWEQDLHMTVSNGVASIDISLKQGDELKIRLDNAWDTSYGGACLDIKDETIAAAFESHGGNIRAKADGNYTIKINLSTHKIDITGEITGELPTTVKVTFNITYDTHGKTIYIVGDFSNWKLDGALELSWTEGNVWTGTFDLEVGTTLSYKFVIASDGEIITWEGGSNRSLTVTAAETINASWQ